MEELEIEELRKKISLSESIKKSCYEEGEEEKLKNAHYIATLKENIASQKIAESGKPTFSCPIKGALYKNKQSRELVEWFDQWILDTEKQINLLKHVEKKNLETISMLEEEKFRLSTRPASGRNEELSKKVQELENNLEKMQMKITEAEFVEKKYAVVITILDDEILQLQKDSAILDSEVSKTKSELHKLQSTADNALKSSRSIQAQLLQENSQFQKQKCTWEQSLRTFHQQVDRILDTNIRRKSIERVPSANETFISCEESSSPATEGLTRSYSKDILEKFKMSAGSGETIMLELNDTGNDMVDTITKLQERVSNLQEEKERLQMELETNVVSTKLTTNISAKYEQQNERLKEQQHRKMKALKSAEMYTKFMATLRAALRQLNTTIALGCKINSVGSPSPDDTIELLTTSMERVEYLVEQSQDFDRENAIQIYEGVKFNDNVEEAQLMLKPKSKSVKLVEEPKRTSVKLDEYDSAEQEILTRATIKRQAKTMIDHHAKLHSKGSSRAQVHGEKGGN